MTAPKLDLGLKSTGFSPLRSKSCGFRGAEGPETDFRANPTRNAPASAGQLAAAASDTPQMDGGSESGLVKTHLQVKNHWQADAVSSAPSPPQCIERGRGNRTPSLRLASDSLGAWPLTVAFSTGARRAWARDSEMASHWQSHLPAGRGGPCQWPQVHAKLPTAADQPFSLRVRA